MEDGMRLKQDSADGSLVVPASMSRNISQWTDNFSGSITEKNKSNHNIQDFTTQLDTLTCRYYSSDDLRLDHCQELDHCGGTSSDSSPCAEEDNSASTSVSGDSDSEEGNLPSARGGIINPNYPGFHDLADQLNDYEETNTIYNNNITIIANNSNNHQNNSNINASNNSNNIILNNNNNENYNNNNNSTEHLCNLDSVNQLESVHHKTFYDTPKFNLPIDSLATDLTNINLKPFDPQSVQVKDLNISDSKLEVKCFNKKSNDSSDSVQVTDMATNIAAFDLLKENNKMADAFLSGVKDEIRQCEDTNRTTEAFFDKLSKEDEDKEINEKEKEDDPVVPRKKEKMEINFNVKKGWVQAQPSNIAVTCRPRVDLAPRSSLANRRSLPSMREKKKSSPEVMGGFDVYNIETAMPHIDLDAIETHLRAAREEERRRRNDREEIRRRLATGCDTDEYYGGDRPGKKPSLQARLQSGMNLQICFMNETMSDTESPGSDAEPSSAVASPIKIKSNPEPPRSLNLSNKCVRSGISLPLSSGIVSEADFFARQARLQAEARVALAQAKDMAHMQMEIERQRRQASPITEMLRASLKKVGVLFPEERRRLSRQMLTDMNLAQLQVIVNDLHTQIEYLNESLVKFLMERDDLHMSQDSMLVDIEDLTRYLGAKENTLRDDVSQNNNNNNNNNNNIITSSISRPKINRIAALVKK